MARAHGVEQAVTGRGASSGGGGRDSAERAEARAIVARIVGEEQALSARPLAPLDAKKNVVIGYRDGADRYVLKVYRQSFRYTVQALKNPISRYVSRAFTLRSLPAARVQAELDGIAGFRLAGLRTFEVVARPRRSALVFRHQPGETLRDLLERVQDPELARRYVRRVAEDLGRRHRLAVERGDLRMIHPAPRVQHVWVCPDDTLLYYDFEDRVNPALRIGEAAAMETENFFFYLLRLRETADAQTIDVAVHGVGEDVMRRWQEHDAARRRGLSGSARRRSGVLAAVLRARADVPPRG